MFLSLYLYIAGATKPRGISYPYQSNYFPSTFDEVLMDKTRRGAVDTAGAGPHCLAGDPCQ